MASGSYAKKPSPQPPLEVQSKIPLRATRHLVTSIEEEPDEDVDIVVTRKTRPTSLQPAARGAATTKPVFEKPDPVKITTAPKAKATSKPLATFRQTRIIDDTPSSTFQKNKPWLVPLIAATLMAVTFSAVLLSAAIFQRPGEPQLVNYFGGKVYDVQVGGNLANTWQGNQPMKPKVTIPLHPGPYSVLGKPTLNVDFINRVLAAYGSPAAGKGQALYDLGIKYQIDPAFALAFFLHESTMGTAGEARATRSLGNLRCIPNADCVDQDRGGYASFPTWEAGFEAWYKLIRNLYVAQLGLTTVDQIIPTYAPTADHNNEAAYIGSLKHSIATWHAGILMP